MNGVIKLTEEQANAKIIDFLGKIIDCIDAEIDFAKGTYLFKRSYKHRGQSFKELKFITKLEYNDLLKLALKCEGISISDVEIIQANNKFSKARRR